MTAKKTTLRKRKKPTAAKTPTSKAGPAGGVVKIGPAKGRPMLQWVGKRPLRSVTAFPAQRVETYDPLGTGVPGGLLYHGDNKEVLAHLLANGLRGKVNLIYIDPPFDSGADYVRKVTLRGRSAIAKLEGESQSLGEQVQYTDIWANDNYLQFLFDRLVLMKELLADDGFILLQCDHRKNHHVRCVLDEVFGPTNFRNEIASRRGITSVQAQFETIDSLIPGYYTTLLYSKGTDSKLPILRFERVITSPGKWDTLWRNHDRHTMRYELCGVTPKEGQWRWAEPRGKRAEANHLHYQAGYADKIGLDEYILDHFDATGEMLDMVRKSSDGTVQCYIPPQATRLANNVWMDFPHMGSLTDYPTEKSEEMLRRVIEWCAPQNALVLDCFIGSGTTAAVAQKLGRRWIGADINKGAIQTTSKRLQSIVAEQIAAKEKRETQGELIVDENATPVAAQFSFEVHRVNDYDLQIQHNEAVAMACEHIGVERTKTDRYFDGTQGKRLVKITPFNHPLSPTDLEELKTELKARKNEERDILLVCLGKELACDAWLTEWNRLRKRGNTMPNKIEVIELRTDAKYGKFFEHKPATANVNIARKAGEIQVEIVDFISPSILERLDAQEGIVKPQVTDWRSMVDSVMIDSAFDGQVFNIALTDLPEKKTDFVKGRYSLPAPKGKTTVAVKITDMLGEEVVVQEQV